MECWSTGVLEYWMVKAGKIILLIALNPLLHYSTTPLLHYSNRERSQVSSDDYV